jgi:hypothetical protein
MAKPRKAWIFSPGQSKASLPGTLKDEVDTKARELIESVLKPKHLQPPPKGSQLNYIEDITTKWLGSKCYFVSIYEGGPHSLDQNGACICVCLMPMPVPWGGRRDRRPPILSNLSQRRVVPMSPPATYPLAVTQR